MRASLLLTAFMLCSIFPASAALEDPKGVWDLDSTFDGYFTTMAPLDASSLLAGTDYSFASDPAGYTFLQTQVFTPATKRLTVINSIGVNGGGSATRTNQWSVVMDVKFDSLSPYAGFLQLDPANVADVTFYVTAAGALISSVGTLSSAGAVTAGTWHRLAITCGNNGAGGSVTVRAYLNGAPIAGSTPRTTAFDGLASMRPSFHLFTDNNAELRPSKLNSLGLWGEELSAADIARLGGPVPSGILASGLVNPLAPPFNQSTIAPAAASFYGFNMGWVTARPSAAWGAVIGENTCSGFAYSYNCGWVTLGDASPANGIRYSNTDGADHGINHDGLGNLSGLAWGANIGWINFGLGETGAPRPLNDPVRPRFSLITGQFTGYAHSANLGWIDLSTLATSSLAGPDTDGDGIADAWEREKFTYLTVANGSSDFDKDGVSDKKEAIADTNPSNPASRLPVVSFGVDFLAEPGQMRVEASFTSSARRVYRLESSGNLVSPWIDRTGYFQGAGGITELSYLAPLAPRHFLRIASFKPLPH